MGLKQKGFGMRRRTTGLKHMCDKDYMSIRLTLLKMKWTVAAAAVTVVAAGSGAQAAGGGHGGDNGCGCTMAGGVMPQL
jgi:hypothetical protein